MTKGLPFPTPPPTHRTAALTTSPQPVAVMKTTCLKHSGGYRDRESTTSDATCRREQYLPRWCPTRTTGRREKQSAYPVTNYSTWSLNVRCVRGRERGRHVSKKVPVCVCVCLLTIKVCNQIGWASGVSLTHQSANEMTCQHEPVTICSNLSLPLIRNKLSHTIHLYSQ